VCIAVCIVEEMTGKLTSVLLYEHLCNAVMQTEF